MLNILTHGRKFTIEKDNIRFLNDIIFTKGSYDVTIYYKNGNTEKTYIRDAGKFVSIIRIKNDEYYMNKNPLIQ